MNTRSKTLEKDLKKIERSKDLALAREIVAPLVAKAHTSVTSAKAITSRDDEEATAKDLSEIERKTLTSVFKIFDRDHDGEIDVDELEAVLRNLGFRPSIFEVSAIIKEASVENATTIKLSGFLDMMARVEAEVEKEKELEEEEKRKREEEKRKREEEEKIKSEKKFKKENETDENKEASASESESEEDEDEEEEESFEEIDDPNDKDFKLKTKKRKRIPKKAAPRKTRKTEAGKKRKVGKKTRADRESTPPLTPPKKLQRPLLTKGNSQLLLKKQNSILRLQRGLSISDFYTPFAGLIGGEIVAERDAFSNPSGREFDLGKEGAFGVFSVLVGIFCSYLTEEGFGENAGKALREKGFRIISVRTEAEFITGLSTADVAWIVSDKEAPSDQLVEAVVKFHESGHGIALWADNYPWVASINPILTKIAPGAKLVGNTPGKNNLGPGDSAQKGQFAKHLLTSGIQSLFEGVTLCYLDSAGANMGSLSLLATSSDGFPCMLYADYDTGLTAEKGRILIDCGFTKLYKNWDTAGTGRYVRNVCVWLLGLDHRLAIGAELQGDIPKKLTRKVHHTTKDKSRRTTRAGAKTEDTEKMDEELVWVWQYSDNGWYNYDPDASVEVEKVYEHYLKNPTVDVRSVHSGDWNYQIDFKQMTQQNLQHTNHTTRAIRRIQLPASQVTSKNRFL